MAKEIDVTTCSEVMLFIYIEQLGYMLWWQIHESADGRVPMDFEWEKAAEAKLQAAGNQTTRFGVVEATTLQKNMCGDEVMAASKEYCAWYDWWNRWYKGLSEDDSLAIQKRVGTGDSLADVHPDGNWRTEEPDHANTRANHRRPD